MHHTNARHAMGRAEMNRSNFTSKNVTADPTFAGRSMVTPFCVRLVNSISALTQLFTNSYASFTAMCLAPLPLRSMARYADHCDDHDVPSRLAANETLEREGIPSIRQMLPELHRRFPDAWLET
jgi:hypothetical protein